MREGKRMTKRFRDTQANHCCRVFVLSLLFTLKFQNRPAALMKWHLRRSSFAAGVNHPSRSFFFFKDPFQALFGNANKLLLVIVWQASRNLTVRLQMYCTCVAPVGMPLSHEQQSHVTQKTHTQKKKSQVLGSNMQSITRWPLAHPQSEAACL